jgi:hypothetical protein
MSTPIDQEPKHTETSLSPPQRWTPSRGSRRENRTLPSWESFPLQDRHLLIRLIVQTARRQVQDGRMQQGKEATR